MLNKYLKNIGYVLKILNEYLENIKQVSKNTVLLVERGWTCQLGRAWPPHFKGAPN